MLGLFYNQNGKEKMSKKLIALSMVGFIGTKSVLATPMTRLEYNQYRGWDVPSDENPSDDGYLVEYLDGGQANHEAHAGYISWSPKQVFSNAYRPNGSFNFGDALMALKQGKKVARSGWNGKGMWLILTQGRIVENLEPNSFYEKCGFEAPVTICSHIDMKAADGSMVVGWLASQTDVLADDWVIIS